MRSRKRYRSFSRRLWSVKRPRKWAAIPPPEAEEGKQEACLERLLETFDEDPEAWPEWRKRYLRLRIIKLGKEGKINTGGRAHDWTKCCPLKEAELLRHALDLMETFDLPGAEQLICDTSMIWTLWELCGHKPSKATTEEIDDTRRVLLNMRKKGLLKRARPQPLFKDQTDD